MRVIVWVVQFLVLAAFLGGVGWLIYKLSHFEEERRKAFASLAADLGLEYSAQASERLMDRLRRFPLFERLGTEAVTNVLRGEARGIEVEVFDLGYSVGSGKPGTNRYLNAIAFFSDDLALPAFRLRPENCLDRLGGKMGWNDVNFDSHPDFSKRYWLEGPDEDALRSAFTARILDDFEAHGGLTVMGAGDCLLVYRGEQRRPVEQTLPLMEDGFAVYSIFTAHGS